MLRPSASTIVASISRSCSTIASAEAEPESGAVPLSTKAWNASHMASAEPLPATVSVTWTVPAFFSRSERVERWSPCEGAGSSTSIRRRAESTSMRSTYSGANGR